MLSDIASPFGFAWPGIDSPRPDTPTAQGEHSSGREGSRNMNRLISPFLLALALFFPLTARGGGQEAAQQRGRLSAPEFTHTLTGDFRVEDSRASGNLPQNFQIVLYNSMGRTMARQSVANNGRYSFSGLPNGEYYLAVEVGGGEVLRVPVRMELQTKEEVRQDLELEWRGGTTFSGGRKDRIISAADVYNRTPAGAKLFEKAEDAMSKKDYKQAVTLLKQLVTDDAGDYQAWTELGTACFKQEKYPEAEQAFQKAVAAKPDYKLALLNLGRLYFSQQKYDLAIEPLTRGVELAPPSAEANLLPGETYLQIKKGSKAVGYLNEAIRLDPNGMAEAHLRLATLYRAAGIKDKAVAEYEQFLTKRPNHPDREKIRQYIAENKKQ